MPGLSQKLLRPLLAFTPLRRRLALTLRLDYFSDLELYLPLTHGLMCPWDRENDRLSLSEIFFKGEYHQLLAESPLPERWLDLGCHAGYFSLWLEWQRRRAGRPAGSSQALLADADARRVAAAGQLLRLNQLGPPWRALHGVIGAGAGARTFYERGNMSSSLHGDGAEPGRAVTVPVLPPAALAAALPPPYDLIKLDIEGAEDEFVEHYAGLWQTARRVLAEWHAPALRELLRARLGAAGFTRFTDFPGGDPGGTTGVLLAARPA